MWLPQTLQAKIGAAVAATVVVATSAWLAAWNLRGVYADRDVQAVQLQMQNLEAAYKDKLVLQEKANLLGWKTANELMVKIMGEKNEAVQNLNTWISKPRSPVFVYVGPDGRARSSPTDNLSPVPPGGGRPEEGANSVDGGVRRNIQPELETIVARGEQYRIERNACLDARQAQLTAIAAANAVKP